MNALVYVDIDQGIHKGKMKVAQNEKRKKLLGFSFYINIGNFEAFIWNLNLSTNCLFWRCEFSNDWIILLVGKTSERCQRRAEINFYW